MIDTVAPYPSPDFSDPELLDKELLGGAFPHAIFAELRSFTPAMSRYEASLREIQFDLLRHDGLNLQGVDVTMHGNGIGFLKQVAYLPYRIRRADPEPIVVYDPLDHYTSIEYHGRSSRILGDAPIRDFYCSTIYYDPENPGLFGTKFVRDDDGNVVERYEAFVSLLDFSVYLLGRWPGDAVFDSRSFVGYTKGAAIYKCYVNDDYDELVSFTFDGAVYRVGGVEKLALPLGDSGCVAVVSGGVTIIFDQTLSAVHHTNGDYVTRNISESQPQSSYPFGAKIGGTIYYPRDAESAYAYRRRQDGSWSIRVVEYPLWMFQKATKYDYVTDGWLHPLRSLGYNLIVRGVWAPSGIHRGDQLKGADRYGDLVERNNTLYHTFDFRRYTEVTDTRARDSFYGFCERVWTGGVGGIAGYLPYVIAVFDQDDKTVLQFEGFVFRIDQTP
ncbi:hypothetical protein [Nitratifractor sp.]